MPKKYQNAVAHQAITNRYEQYRSNPTLPPPQNAGLLNLRTVVRQQSKIYHCIVAK